MKIELHKIKVKDVFDGYRDSEEEGVVGYGGKLDIRPKYQREFVYKEKQRNAVIDTIRKDFPLNVMYWAKKEDGTFEILDGQQRTISFCQYMEGDFSIDNKYFHSLTADERAQIENYDLYIYICEGTERERLEWFKTINIAGEKLTNQELLNAVYSGPWLTDAKRHFSKTNCAAYGLAEKYMWSCQEKQNYAVQSTHATALHIHVKTHDAWSPWRTRCRATTYEIPLFFGGISLFCTKLVIVESPIQTQYAPECSEDGLWDSLQNVSRCTILFGKCSDSKK